MTPDNKFFEVDLTYNATYITYPYYKYDKEVGCIDVEKIEMTFLDLKSLDLRWAEGSKQDLNMEFY